MAVPVNLYFHAKRAWTEFVNNYCIISYSSTYQKYSEMNKKF